MALDATIAGTASNTYALSADVDAYILLHMIPTATAALWTALTAPQKEAALIRAAQLLDRHINWAGSIREDDQALAWPRSSAYDRFDRVIADDIIPAFVKEFQIETALWIIEQSGAVPESGVGDIDYIRVGTLEVNFNEKGATRRMLLPDSVISSVSPMGQYAAQFTGGASSISLIRS